MSSTDPMRVDSSTLSEIMQRTSLRPFHFHQLLNTKSSLLMKQIIQPAMFNSSYGHLLRSLVATADSSSPATTKTKSSNHSIPDVPSLILESRPKTNQNLLQSSLKGSKRSWIKRKLKQMIKFLPNL